MNIPLKKIVAEFLDSADQSSHQFRRLYNIGVRGMREFNLDVTGTLKTEVLDINANKTCELPCDYLSYSKIGVLNDKGEVLCFKRNDQLSNYNQFNFDMTNRSEGAPMVTSIGNWTNPTSFPFFFYNYWMGGTSYNLFGLNSGTADLGNYKVDEEAGIILLDSRVSFSQIVLEYIADGQDSECGDYMVNPKAEEAFICYLRWKNATDLYKKFSPSQVRMFKMEYYRERKLAKMRINKVIIEELQSVKRALTKLVAKA